MALTPGFINRSLPVSQFNHFAVFHLPVINHKADYCSPGMPALFSRRTGIHVEALKFLIVDHFQNMGMAANEQLGGMGGQFFFHGWRILPRITPNMCHKNIHFFCFPSQIFGESMPDFRSVDISVYALQGLEMR